MIDANKFDGFWNGLLSKDIRKSNTYYHFDKFKSIERNENLLKSYLTNEKKLTEHHFHPFIKYKVPKNKYWVKDGKRKSIPKDDLKYREICFASHLDSIIYAWFSYLLSIKYEKILEEEELTDVVSAYRKIERNGEKYSNIHIARDAFSFIEKTGECYVLVTDISKFFDKMNHELLKEKWQLVMGCERLNEPSFQIFKSLTNFSFVEKNDIEKAFPNYKKKGLYTRQYCSPKEYREKIVKEKLVKKNTTDENNNQVGIPQGTPISALLSNIYMLDFDKQILACVESLGGFYRRYSDDILIVIKDKNKAEKLNKLLKKEIGTCCLEIKDEKTNEYLFEKQANEKIICLNKENMKPLPLQYLGFNFDGERILIREGSIANLHIKMNKAVKKAVIMTNGRDSKSNEVYKKKLYNNFSLKRNLYTDFRTEDDDSGSFIDYAKRAARIMESDDILRQLRRMPININKSIERHTKRFLKKKKRKLN